MKLSFLRRLSLILVMSIAAGLVLAPSLQAAAAKEEKKEEKKGATKPADKKEDKKEDKKGEEKKEEEKKEEKKKSERIFFFRFNENGGFQTFDLTSNRLHCEIYYGQWKADENRRTVCVFDGGKAWGEILSRDALEIDKVGFAAWIFPEALPANAALFSKRGGSKDGMAMGLDEKGNLFFSPKKDVMAKSTSAVKTGQWNHIGISYDGSKATFYIDGAAAGAVRAGDPGRAGARQWHRQAGHQAGRGLLRPDARQP